MKERQYLMVEKKDDKADAGGEKKDEAKPVDKAGMPGGVGL